MYPRFTTQEIHEYFHQIISPYPPSGSAITLGRSRSGQHPILGYRFGNGPLRISLIGGCHADEPVGPRLLRHLVQLLGLLPAHHKLLNQLSWWIVPHINPDGERRNEWYTDHADSYDLVAYLSGVVREPPGDDIEFGFPHNPADHAARRENRAVYDWWHTDSTPFTLHATLHGMGFAAGPWFLVEPSWRNRLPAMQKVCTATVHAMGYTLHDVDRQGEKGFVRISRGFCTRPDSGRMRDHFLELGDPETAGLFRPNSMETVRDFGGDPLTLVSEMPLFITPGVGEELGPPDPQAARWRQRINTWREQISNLDRKSTEPTHLSVREDILASGIQAMPVIDQMRLQWSFILHAVNAAVDHAASS